MIISELKTGTRFQFGILDSYGKNIGNTYVSQLYEPAKADSIIVYVPIFESRLIFVPVNTKVQLCFPYKQGFMGFSARVIERGRKGNISVLYLKVESPLELIQRRGSYRLDCNIPIEYRTHNAAAKDTEANTHPYKKALSKNISGTGACIIIYEEMPKDSVLELRMHLTDTLVIEVICSVIRCVKMDMLKNSRYEVGLCFTKTNSYNQDCLIKYIFEQQRWHLKKEKP